MRRSFSRVHPSSTLYVPSRRERLRVFNQAGESPFIDPGSLSGLTGWWDASATSTLTLSGAADEFVAQWNDRSGNGKHFAQGVEAAQPRIDLGTINSIAVPRFLGEQRMVTDGPLGDFISASEFTLFMVMQYTATYAGAAFADATERELLGDEGGWCYVAGRHVAPDQAYLAHSTATTTEYVVTTPTVGQPFIIVVRHAAGTVGIALNGAAEVTTASGDTGDIATPWAFVIGDVDGAGDAYKVDIGEVVIYNRYLTSDERTDVYDYLVAKWGL